MKLNKTLLAAAAATLVLPALGYAQEAEVAAPTGEATDQVKFILTSVLFLVGGFLVMFMAAGFAMLEAGLVRSKNVTMQCLKNVALFAIAGIMYYLIGYNLMYPLGSWAIEGYFSALFPAVAVLEPVGVAADAVDDLAYAATGSDYFFQLMFCATTASIVSGTLAERIKLWPFLIFTAVLTGFIYPLTASWQWGGGFLSEMGFSDFAGSTVVHACGGAAALAGVLILGPRIGKYDSAGRTIPMPGNNLTLATLGTFILWLGWFGFNGGSQLAMGTISDVADVSRIFSNTNTAAAGGALAALFMTTILYRKPDLTMVLNGALAGLVSITEEPLAPGLGTATLIGAVGGVLCTLVVPMLDKMKIDDVVGAIPVHFCCGFWGTLVVPFTNGDANYVTQIIGFLSITVFTFVASGIVWLILKGVMGIRAPEEDEIEGLDMAELGMEAYPEFGRAGA